MLPIPRFLKAGNIQLGMKHGHLDEIDPDRDPVAERARLKDAVIEELTDLFMGVQTSNDPSLNASAISNRSKFLHDFRSREAKSSTALADRIAIPHVRSQQTRQFVVVMARSHEGVWYAAPDGGLTHLFFCVSAPPWENDWYLAFYQWIGTIFRDNKAWLTDTLLAAETADDMIATLCGLD